jgi:hypothetical protein
MPTPKEPPAKKQKTPPGSTPSKLQETLDFLKSHGDDAKAKERASTSKMTGSQARSRLGELGVSYEGHGETAVLRQILAHSLELGVLPEKCWTPRSALYTANEMYSAGVSAGDVGKGEAAKEFLRKLIAKEKSPTSRRLMGEFNVAGASDEFKQRMQEMVIEEEARIAEAASQSSRENSQESPWPEGGQEGTPPPRSRQAGRQGSAPKTHGTFGKVWKDALTDLEQEYANFSAERGTQGLGTSPFAWEEMVNFAAAQEWHGPEDAHHFFTVVAQKLAAMPGVVEWDDSGTRDIAIDAGMEEMAHEWLGNLYATCRSKMGSGATFEQVRFSKVANKGLQGGGATGVKPEHLVCLFAQMAAAAKRQDDCGFTRAWCRCRPSECTGQDTCRQGVCWCQPSD